MDSILHYLGGPVFRFSIMLMALGILRLIILTLADIRSAARHAGDSRIGCGAAATLTLAWLVPVRELLRASPLFSVVSLLFHAGIMVVPLFLSEHVLLWEQGTGLSWMTLPAAAADALTLCTAASGVFLLFRRLFWASLRVVSGASGYLFTALIIIIFASGWLAGRSFNPFPRSEVMIVHLVCGNLTMIMLPFTRLSHAVLFPLARIVTAAGWHVRPANGTAGRGAAGRGEGGAS